MSAPTQMESLKPLLAKILQGQKISSIKSDVTHDNANQNAVDVNFEPPFVIGETQIKKLTLLRSEFIAGRYVSFDDNKFDACLAVSFTDNTKQIIGLSPYDKKKLLKLINSQDFRKVPGVRVADSVTFDDYSPQTKPLIDWKSVICTEYYDPTVDKFYENLHSLLDQAGIKLVDALDDVLLVNFGCGNGKGLFKTVQALSPLVHSIQGIGCDISPKSIAEATKNLQQEKFDANVTPVIFAEAMHGLQFLKQLRQKHQEQLVNKKVIFTASGSLTNKVISMQDTAKILQEMQLIGGYVIVSGWQTLAFNKIAAKHIGFELLATDQTQVSSGCPFYVLRSLSKEEITERCRKQLEKNPYFLDLSFSNNPFSIIDSLPAESLKLIKFLDLSFCNFSENPDLELKNRIFQEKLLSLEECRIIETDNFASHLPTKVNIIKSSPDQLPALSHAKQMTFFSGAHSLISEELFSINLQIQEFINVQKQHDTNYSYHVYMENWQLTKVSPIITKLEKIFADTHDTKAGLMLADIYQNGIFAGKSEFGTYDGLLVICEKKIGRCPKAFDIWWEIYSRTTDLAEKNKILLKVKNFIPSLTKAIELTSDITKAKQQLFDYYKETKSMPQIAEDLIAMIECLHREQEMNQNLLSSCHQCIAKMEQDIKQSLEAAAASSSSSASSSDPAMEVEATTTAAVTTFTLPEMEDDNLAQGDPALKRIKPSNPGSN